MEKSSSYPRRDDFDYSIDAKDEINNDVKKENYSNHRYKSQESDELKENVVGHRSHTIQPQDLAAIPSGTKSRKPLMEKSITSAAAATINNKNFSNEIPKISTMNQITSVISNPLSIKNDDNNEISFCNPSVNHSKKHRPLFRGLGPPSRQKPAMNLQETPETAQIIHSKMLISDPVTPPLTAEVSPSRFKSAGSTPVEVKSSPCLLKDNLGKNYNFCADERSEGPSSTLANDNNLDCSNNNQEDFTVRAPVDTCSIRRGTL